MGNKLGRRRQFVDEKYTRPQGLYHHKDVDIKKLKKLILESKLAPCYPGDEECGCDLEECPICFLYYPSLNRSRCCTKGICTECFLQMKVPNSARPTQCPFCKTANYAVEYRGVKTKEEKGIEQIEEQRVIEAKIRMRQKELQDEEERILKRQNLSSSSRSMAPADGDYSSAGVPSRRHSAEVEEIISADDSDAPSVSRQHPIPLANRDDEFDLDLEDIMLMEAIWRSIQESGKQRGQCYSDAAPSEHYISEDRYVSPATAPLTGSSSSPSGGLACAVAALAERQQISGESDVCHSGNISTYGTVPSCSQYYRRVERSDEYCPVEGSMGGLSQESETICNDREWNVDHGSEVAEAGTSYASSDSTEDAGSNSAVAQADEVDGSFQNLPAPIIPESFEEQMMLAMAVSLAEAQAVTSGPGVGWQ